MKIKIIKNQNTKGNEVLFNDFIKSHARPCTIFETQYHFTLIPIDTCDKQQWLEDNTGFIESLGIEYKEI